MVISFSAVHLLVVSVPTVESLSVLVPLPVRPADTLLVDGCSCQEVPESVDAALVLAGQDSVDVIVRCLGVPWGVSADGGVAARSARSRGSRGCSQTLASGPQVAVRPARRGSCWSPAGFREACTGCTGSREARLPVLSDALAPTVVGPTAGADSGAGNVRSRRLVGILASHRGFRQGHGPGVSAPRRTPWLMSDDDPDTLLADHCVIERGCDLARLLRRGPAGPGSRPSGGKRPWSLPAAPDRGEHPAPFVPRLFGS